MLCRCAWATHIPAHVLCSAKSRSCANTSAGTCLLFLHLFHLWKLKNEAAVCIFAGFYCGSSGFPENMNVSCFRSWNPSFSCFIHPLNDSAPDSFQPGLVERQILELLHGLHQNKASTGTQRQRAKGAEAGSVCRKVIQAQDVCPICQEELLEKKQPVCFCRSVGDTESVKWWS